MRKPKQLTTLPIAAAFIGTVVGAGFATGQEVLQFFTFFGRNSIFGIVVSTLLFCYFGSVIMSLSRELKAGSHSELVMLTGGRVLGRILDWAITLSFLGVLIVMAAGAGAATEEQLHLSPLLGSILVIVLSFLTVISGVDSVIRVIGLVVPFLLLAVLGVSAYSLLHNPISVQNINLLETLPSAVTGRWYSSSILYVAYNILMSVGILAPLGSEAANKKSIIYGGILGGLGLGLGILAINLAIISGVPAILSFQVPMLYLASRLNPMLAYAYCLILLLEIFTTAVSILYGFVARMASTSTMKALWAASASIAALLAAQMGFSKVIVTVYPLIGLIGMFLLAGILWLPVKKRFSFLQSRKL